MEFTVGELAQAVDRLAAAADVDALEGIVALLQSVAIRAAKAHNTAVLARRAVAGRSASSSGSDSREGDPGLGSPSCRATAAVRLALRSSDHKEANDGLVREPRELAPQVLVRVATVPDAGAVPNAPLCWLADEQAFAFRVGGVLFSGQIGDLFRKGRLAAGVRPCTRQSGCASAGSKKCRFWHRGQPRNFLESAWVHAKSVKNARNAHMRHFGARQSLANDLAILALDSGRDAELDLRRATTCHDVLVALAAHATGLLAADPGPQRPGPASAELELGL